METSSFTKLCTCGHTSTCDCAPEEIEYVTNPVHGGKESCANCSTFVNRQQGYFKFHGQYWCKPCWEDCGQVELGVKNIIQERVRNGS